MCPVSSTIDFSMGFLGYPSNIFHNSTLNDLSDLYNCTAISKIKYNSCRGRNSRTQVPCPLQEFNVQSATKSSSKIPRTSCGFVNVVDSVHNPIIEASVTNVHFFGTSVTFGIGTEGCCCVLDEKCYSIHKEEDGIRHCKSLERGCGYVEWLRRWFHHEYHGRIKVHNHAWGGQTSGSHALSNHDHLTFTESDIIFIDYSVNDYDFYGRKKSSLDRLLEGAEHFLR